MGQPIWVWAKYLYGTEHAILEVWLILRYVPLWSERTFDGKWCQFLFPLWQTQIKAQYAINICLVGLCPWLYATGLPLVFGAVMYKPWTELMNPQHVGDSEHNCRIYFQGLPCWPGICKILLIYLITLSTSKLAFLQEDYSYNYGSYFVQICQLLL